MKPEEYEIMFRVEDGHWWYAGLRALLHQFWGRYVRVPEPQVLDVGCGTGAILDRLGEDAQAAGVDFALEAIRFCRTRGIGRSAVASALALPFDANGFDVVVSFDVLCHSSIPDKHVAMRELYRVVKPGGLLLLNLPAYHWVRSSHDVAVHTDHRFTKREVVDLL
ncbi:MAG TPA: class I SAM-dependent methyltransferase, partial [Candidatus Hydrogenedentes bacterium]|nr:class I SAM-dependent methyltransferase [Candidatus Hydrogenedentota bacterium]